jgi:hypothetical protein
METSASFEARSAPSSYSTVHGRFFVVAGAMESRLIVYAYVYRFAVYRFITAEPSALIQEGRPYIRGIVTSGDVEQWWTSTHAPR